MQLIVLRDLSVLWSLFHILVLFMMLYRSRFSRKKTVWLTVICMIPLGLLNVAGLVCLGAEKMGQLFLFTCTLPSLLFYYHMSQDRKGRFIFTFCLSDTVAYWIIIITHLLDFYVGGQRYVLMFFGRLLLFPLIEWYAFRVLRKPYIELQSSVERGWNVFAAMSALYYVLLAVMANFPVIITKRTKEIPAFLLVLLLMPLNYYTIFVAMYRQLLLYRRQKKELVFQELKQQMEVQLADQKHIHRLKHDMRAHIVTLSGLLSSDKTREAREYLSKLQPVQDGTGKQYCGNPYLNAILSHYMMKFEEIGVPLRLDIQVGDALMPYMELCQILSNGLENAYEASGCITEGAEVSVQMKFNRDWLLIRIRNRCQAGLQVIKGKIPDTKKKEAGHGLGLKTIQEAAEMLGGDMSCYTENGYFILDVMVRG